MRESLGAPHALSIILLCLLVIQSIAASHTPGVNADTGTALKVDFNRLWETKLDRSYVTSPVYADGFIYAVCTHSGSGTGTLACMNASSGAQVWNDTRLFYAYAVAGDRVYVGSAVWDTSTSWVMQGAVYCLNAYDGTQIWNYSHGTSFSTPVVVGDIVYVPGFNYTMSTGINFGFIYALNALTGEEIWRWTGTTNTRFDYAPLLVSGKCLYALSAAYSEQDASWTSGIYAFDAQSGTELWNYSNPGQFSSMAVADGAVFVSSNFVNTTDYTDAQYSGGYVYKGGILALDASSGAGLWDFQIMGSVESPILGDKAIYAVSHEGTVYALNAADGAKIWEHATTTNLGHGLFANGFLYAGSPEGVYCFNPANGAVRWDFRPYDTRDASITYPVYADGVIYVGWNGAQFFSSITQEDFHALDALTGERIGNYSLGYTAKSLPLMLNGTIYVGASWVTEESPDWLGPGAIVALNSTITHVPIPQPISVFAVLLAATASFVAVGVGLLLYHRKRKKEGPLACGNT